MTWAKLMAVCGLCLALALAIGFLIEAMR